MKNESNSGVQMSEKTPIHNWVHDGKEVLVVRFCGLNGESGFGFKYPLEAGKKVSCPDWDPKPERGNGLHGWPWGTSIGDGKDPEWAAMWLVIGVNPKDVVYLNGKVKFSKGTIRLAGKWQEAMAYVRPGLIAWTEYTAEGVSSSTGTCSASSSTGYNSKGRAGTYGTIALAWWNQKDERGEMRARETGCGDGSDGKLKADTWYSLNEAGEFVEVAA